MAAARLPKEGGDANEWGNILNTFLLVEHNDDGTLKKAGDIATAKTNAATALSTAEAAQTAAQAAPKKLDDLQDVSTAGASTGQVLKYDGTTWLPGTDADSGGTGGGDPTMGGDLSGTASTAQIKSGAVGSTELADGAVTTAKLSTGVQTDLNGKVNATDLAVVATSGDYNDLINKPSAGGSGGSQTAVAVAGDYTASSGDFVIADSSAGALTITLSGTPSNGDVVSVKRVNPTGNGVLVMPAGGVKIDDLTSDTVNNQWQSQDYFSDGTKWYRV